MGGEIYSIVSLGFDYDNKQGIWFFVYNSKLCIELGDGAGLTFKQKGTINVGTSYHVAFVYEDSTNKCNLYIDGVEYADTTISTVVYDAVQDDYIGKDYRGYVFDGLIDEVRISTHRSSAWVGASYEDQQDNINVFGVEEYIRLSLLISHKFP